MVSFFLLKPNSIVFFVTPSRRLISSGITQTTSTGFPVSSTATKV
jgi:hypothetical protein